MKSHHEILLAQHISERDIPEPKTQYQFAREIGRHWRSDFAWPEYKLLVEVEGGIEIKGRRSHTGSEGYQKDCRKYNDAAWLGFWVMRFTPMMIHSMEAINEIHRFIEARRLAQDPWMNELIERMEEDG